MLERTIREEPVEEFKETLEILEWFKGFKQIDKEKEECTPIVEWIRSVKFQTMFNMAKEATSSDP